MTRTGDWIDLVALNWAVFQLTNSPIQLGIVNACRLVPVFLMSVPAGVLADRYDRRKLLMFTQVSMMALTFLLGYLIHLEASFWVFTSIVTLRAMISAVEVPVSNALLPNLIPASCLQSAIALNTTILNLSRIIGPAIAGVLLGYLDISTLFYINGCSSIGILLCLQLISTVSDQKQSLLKAKKQGDLQEMIAYLKEHTIVRNLLWMAILPMVFGFPYTSMMPVFASELLGLEAKGFALLLSISAVGAILASIWLSFGKAIAGAGKWLITSIIGFGLSLVLFVSSSSVVMAGIAMFLIGATSQLYRTMSRITIQQQVPDQLRGRIMSIALMDRGFIPLGALLIGTVAEWAGAYHAGLLMGMGCILVIGFVLWKREIWNI